MHSQYYHDEEARLHKLVVLAWFVKFENEIILQYIVIYFILNFYKLLNQYFVFVFDGAQTYYMKKRSIRMGIII